MTTLVSRKTRWFVLRGFSQERRGDFARAEKWYNRGVSRSKTSHSANDVRWLHPGQFFLERIRFRLGRPEVNDPLFLCEISPAIDCEKSDTRTPGRFGAEFVFSGLKIMGIICDTSVARLEICIDRKPIRSIHLRGNGRWRKLDFLLTRETVKRLPTNSVLSIKTDGGQSLLLLGARGSGLTLRVSHGDGTLFEVLDGGAVLDKKGSIAATKEEIRSRQDELILLYDAARKRFDSLFDTKLFLMYGTLLGYYRQGGLIPGDDDFDVGYVSHFDEPEQVKAETIRIVETLIREGFVVSINSRGRLFRLSGVNAKGIATHIDVRPLWFSDGRVWAHNHFVAVADSSRFLPVEKGALNNVEVYVPRDTEWFLLENYGPDWRIPDPAFVYDRQQIPKAVFTVLDKALINPVEYRSLKRRVENERYENETMGNFISLAEEDFYPLRGLESDPE